MTKHRMTGFGNGGKVLSFRSSSLCLAFFAPLSACAARCPFAPARLFSSPLFFLLLLFRSAASSCVSAGSCAPLSDSVQPPPVPRRFEIFIGSIVPCRKCRADLPLWQTRSPVCTASSSCVLSKEELWKPSLKSRKTPLISLMVWLMRHLQSCICGVPCTASSCTCSSLPPNKSANGDASASALLPPAPLPRSHETYLPAPRSLPLNAAISFNRKSSSTGFSSSCSSAPLSLNKSERDGSASLSPVSCICESHNVLLHRCFISLRFRRGSRRLHQKACLQKYRPFPHHQTAA